MKSSDITIRRCFLCTLDPRQDFPVYNSFIPGGNDEIAKYIDKLLIYNIGSMKSKPATYREDSYLMQILPESEENFEAFVNIISDEFFSLMKENTSLVPGCGVFVWTLIDEQNYIAFFKLDYQSRLMNEVGANGQVAWKLNQSLLPNSSQKGYEFFIINLDMQRVLVSDKIYYVNNDEPVNYIADYILKIRLNQSEKEMLEQIDEAVLDTISQCYNQDVQQKVFAYHTAMAEKVEEDGRIHMGEVAEEIFADNEDAVNVCKEKLSQNKIPSIPVMVGRNTEKKLLKKHKIVTSNGIEILVPPDLLKDAQSFSYGKDSAGNTIITIIDRSGLSAGVNESGESVDFADEFIENQNPSADAFY